MKIFLAAFCLLVSGSIAAAPSSSNAEPLASMKSVALDNSQEEEIITYWEEEIPSDTLAETPAKSTKLPRRWIWQGRMQDRNWMDQADQEKRDRQAKSKAKPHPMRTDLWELKVSVSSKEASLVGIPPENRTLALEFSEDGFVRIHSSQSHTNSCIGKWKLHPSGLAWHIPVRAVTPDQDAMLQTVVHYHADLILNPFGPRPHMVRGTISRDRFDSNPWFGKEWFRPVIGTFTGVGTGDDTADVSYGERRFGLSKPPAAPQS